MSHPLFEFADGLPPSRPLDIQRSATIAAGFAALILAGAIFGFFYAWVCSTMWGLDAAPPMVAVQAMQAMNASVRNAVFAPAFFGTPLVLALTAVLAGRQGNRTAALLFGAAAVLYIALAFLPTMLGNVPMNEALAAQGLLAAPEAAAQIWAEYSPRWQMLNQLRTIASGGVLVLTGLGLRAL